MPNLRDLGKLDAVRDEDTARLDRPVDARLLWVPRRMVLYDRRLSWNWNPPPRPRVVAPGMLEGFLKLLQEDDQAILRYAQRWGPLGICEHGEPHTHRPIWCQPVLDGCADGAGEWAEVEQVSAWRSYAAEARTILEVASALKWSPGGVDWPAEEAYTVMSGHIALAVCPEGYRPKAGEKWAMNWDHVLLGVNRWLDDGDVRPQLEWLGDSRLAVRLGTATEGMRHGYACRLFGALATQMLLAVSGAKGLGSCSGCGDFFFTSRELRLDRGNYCETCQKKRVSARRAQAKYRGKQEPDRR